MTKAKKTYEKKICKYFFTGSELSEIADRETNAILQLDIIDTEKKSSMSTFKNRHDAVMLDMKLCATMRKNGYEERNIECEVVKDYDADTINYIRCDNNEVAYSRKMLKSERQMDLDEVTNGLDEPVADSNEKIVADNATKKAMTSEKSAL